MRRFWQTILATGMIEMFASLLIHRFIYADERTWWTRHRLGPGIGAAIAMFGAAACRHCLREAVEAREGAELQPGLPVAMDWLATLGAAASAAIGIVAADMLREWLNEGG